MLKQDLKPDEDEHDATHDGGGFFVARAKGVADRYAGDGEDKRCAADRLAALANLLANNVYCTSSFSVKASHSILPPMKAKRIKAIQWSMGPMMPMN